ncbi:MAG: PASTA domain-containing protein, partial [Clostridia bacterium]|nr:PASTA domain-containing protein [Clostridia bacterium]
EKLDKYENSDERKEDALELAKKQVKNDEPSLNEESSEFEGKVQSYYKENYNTLYEQAYTNKKFELTYAMWKNKAITELYEPGSTSKIITTAMVFEEGVVKPTDSFTCTGALKVEGFPRPISCHDHKGHGTVSYARGLQQSCNPTLMLASFRLGESKFFRYFENFGYTGITGIDLPGEAAGLYTPEKDFTHVSLAVYSFGQTYKTTPIQQITAISAVANGGYLVTPHLLGEVVDDDGNVIKTYETDVKRQVVSTEVCKTISEILEDGVSGDGGAKNAYVKGYKIAAKTGTSEKRDITDAALRVSSTVAYAPYDDPEIAILIMVDEPMGGVVYGSRVAAPYVANFMANVLPYLGYEPQYTEEELKNVDVNILNYKGYYLDTAKADIESRGLICEVVGDGQHVVSQVPAEGSTVSKLNGRVILYTGSESAEPTVEVPDVQGKTGEAANRILVNAGLNVRIMGAKDSQSATVISQSVEPGTMVARGTVVEINIVHTDITDD